jgi:hypothetical protein
MKACCSSSSSGRPLGQYDPRETCCPYSTVFPKNNKNNKEAELLLIPAPLRSSPIVRRLSSPSRVRRAKNSAPLTAPGTRRGLPITSERARLLSRSSHQPSTSDSLKNAFKHCIQSGEDPLLASSVSLGVTLLHAPSARYRSRLPLRHCLARQYQHPFSALARELLCELYSGAPKFPSCCHTQMIPQPGTDPYARWCGRRMGRSRPAQLRSISRHCADLHSSGFSRSGQLGYENLTALCPVAIGFSRSNPFNSVFVERPGSFKIPLISAWNERRFGSRQDRYETAGRSDDRQKAGIDRSSRMESQRVFHAADFVEVVESDPFQFL